MLAQLIESNQDCIQTKTTSTNHVPHMMLSFRRFSSNFLILNRLRNYRKRRPRKSHPSILNSTILKLEVMAWVGTSSFFQEDLQKKVMTISLGCRRQQKRNHQSGCWSIGMRLKSVWSGFTVGFREVVVVQKFKRSLKEFSQTPTTVSQLVAERRPIRHWC